jgi:ribosomal protein S18 acetylase RimI-like enzyme
MRQWPNDPTVAHLIFTDHTTVPTAAVIDDALEHARQKGARAVRTSALFPNSTDVVLQHGFVVIDRLALLRHPLTAATVQALPSVESTQAFRPWSYREAADVDVDAFGPLWGNDRASLRDIRHATPHHRLRVVRRSRHIAGIAISGAAGDSGYLQRLAVRSDAHRQGIATRLVVDALRWMHDRSLTAGLVNTGVDNVAALALYAGLGFERLGDQLTIAEYLIAK